MEAIKNGFKIKRFFYRRETLGWEILWYLQVNLQVVEIICEQSSSDAGKLW